MPQADWWFTTPISTIFNSRIATAARTALSSTAHALTGALQTGNLVGAPRRARLRLVGSGTEVDTLTSLRGRRLNLRQIV